MVSIAELNDSLLHLFFPHICAGCGSDRLSTASNICLFCMEAMPVTRFELFANNPVERKLIGRIPFTAATAQFYFAEATLMQHFLHQVKYKGNKELCLQLGVLMGAALKRSGRVIGDALVPLPLFPDKERKRGFNQSELLCKGIAEYLDIPVLKDIVIRPRRSETQTHKGRLERWENIDGKFVVTDPSSIEGKHLLLVDDVITTGATLEACGSELLKATNTRLSIACLCFAVS